MKGRECPTGVRLINFTFPFAYLSFSFTINSTFSFLHAKQYICSYGFSVALIILLLHTLNASGIRYYQYRSAIRVQHIAE